MFYRNEVFKISFAGMMLGCVFLFQYLEKFMPLKMGFIKLNISLIFIIIIHYIGGFKYAIFLFVIRFLVGPGMGSNGYSDVGFWSHFILLTYDFLFFMLFLMIYKWLKKILISVLLSIVIIAIISGFLNGLLFTPVYWAILTKDYGLPVKMSQTLKIYQSVKDVMFFGIPNYWVGTFVVYFLGNVIKFSIIGIILFSINKVLHTQTFSNY